MDVQSSATIGARAENSHAPAAAAAAWQTASQEPQVDLLFQFTKNTIIQFVQKLLQNQATPPAIDIFNQLPSFLFHQAQLESTKKLCIQFKTFPDDQEPPTNLETA
ncbi:MAG: hypothetical protein Q9172_002506 [Xanthocarpia lactea]